MAPEALASQGSHVSVYFDKEEKKQNPYGLRWLGNEQEAATRAPLREHEYFVGTCDKALRRKITERLLKEVGHPLNVIHRAALISPSLQAGEGNLFAAGCLINPQLFI